MVGSVNVSGTITTGNACALRYWKITGTTPTTGTNADYSLPSGVVFTNVVAAYGGVYNPHFMPFNNSRNDTTGDAGWKCSFYISNGNKVNMSVAGVNTGSVPFVLIIVTIA